MFSNFSASSAILIAGALAVFFPLPASAGGADCAPDSVSASAGDGIGGGIAGPSVIGAPGGTGQGTGGMIELIGGTHVPGSAGPGLSGIASAAPSVSGGPENAPKLIRP